MKNIIKAMVIKKIETITVPNNIITNLKFNFSLKDIRSCHIFWKDYAIKCSSEVINQSLLNNKISKSTLKDKYLFAQTGSVNLIVENSTLHKKIIQLESRRKLRKIADKKLIPGHIYSSKVYNHYLFLGNVSHSIIEMKYVGHKKVFQEEKLTNNLILNISEFYEDNIPELMKSIRSSIFDDLCGYVNPHISEFISLGEDIYNKSNFVLDLGEYKDYKNVIKQLRDMGQEKIKNSIVKNKKDELSLCYDLEEFYPIATINSNFDYKKYLAFI